MAHYDKYVPGDGLSGARILLVGEAPGEQENLEGKPFVGESGRLLTSCLGRRGIAREEVYLTNVCHYRPSNNKFEEVLNSDVLKSGLRELYEYIETKRPTVVVALGAWPLFFLTGRKGIKKWRGSILSYAHDDKIKVIPTVHPAAVLRDRSLYPVFDQDIKRIIEDSTFAEKRLPVREFICDPRGLELEEWTQRLCAAEYLGTDIETIKNTTRILCCGFSPSPEIAVCISADHEEGRRSIGRVLRSNAMKIFQFGIFDTTQLIYENGYELRDPRAEILGRPYYWDTLVAQHVLAPELPRSLEFLTSIYTREPYYKTVGRGTIPDDAKGWNERVERQTLWQYNARDCACTIEIALQQMDEIAHEPMGTQHILNFEMQTVGLQRHISVSGLLVDKVRRDLLIDVELGEWSRKQFVLDRLTGFETNVRSPKLKKILYEHLKLPTRRNRDGGITTDEDAIVSLITFCKDHLANLKTESAQLDWRVKLAICQTILEIRGIRQVLSTYLRDSKKKQRVSVDGRMHSIYRIGPETGRWSATKYVDGSGINAQTLPRDPIEIAESVLTNSMIDSRLVAQLEDEPDEDEEETEEAA